MAAKVLDSYALIAYFRDEAGAAQVEALLVRAATHGKPLLMSEVNYAEVQYMLRRKNGDQAWSAASHILQGLPIEFHPATRELADLAAGFKTHHKLSLADAFAAALAKAHKAELVTGDPEFKALAKEIKIQWLDA
jgi:uncharacterized protein